MKRFFFLIGLMVSFLLSVQAQIDMDSTATGVDSIATDSTLYLVVKNDNSEYIGVIISKDAREIQLKTEALGLVYIPMHQVKEIIELGVNERDINNKLLNDRFAKRMFFSSTAIPMGKSEAEIIYSYLTFEARFGIGERTDLSVLTTYAAVPIIFRTRYSFNTDNENFQLAMGLTAGTLSWASPSVFGVAPHLITTIGDQSTNLTLSAGLGVLNFSGITGVGIVNLGSNISLSKKTSLVLESNLFVAEDEIFTAITPGLRIKFKNNNAFQFGFMAGFTDGELFPIPIPNVQYVQTL